MNVSGKCIRLLMAVSLVAILAAGVVIFKNAIQASETVTFQVTNSTPPPLQPSPATTSVPLVAIVSPANNSVIPAGDITVSVRLANFNGTSKLSGFIFYYLDVEPPTGAFIAATTTPGSYVPTTETSCTWKNVTPGTHTFAALLVNQDFTPVMPPTMAKVTIEVVGLVRNPEISASPSVPLRVPPLTPGSTPATTAARAPATGSPDSAPESRPEAKIPSLVIWVSIGVVIVVSVTILVVYNFRSRRP
jgi:hypothetical protein